MHNRKIRFKLFDLIWLFILSFCHATGKHNVICAKKNIFLFLQKRKKKERLNENWLVLHLNNIIDRLIWRMLSTGVHEQRKIIARNYK